MARKYTNIISSSGTSSYTGSITKVVALGANDGEASLSRIEYGLEVQDYGRISSSAQTEWTPISTTGTVQIPAGSALEGPMGRIEVGTGSFLIYFGNNEYFD
tara:strand:+ start:460 stop:765 length:306 start_codon:yes stop_codon:yes gene_type:complete